MNDKMNEQNFNEKQDIYIASKLLLQVFINYSHNFPQILWYASLMEVEHNSIQCSVGWTSWFPAHKYSTEKETVSLQRRNLADTTRTQWSRSPHQQQFTLMLYNPRYDAKTPQPQSNHEQHPADPNWRMLYKSTLQKPWNTMKDRTVTNWRSLRYDISMKCGS